MIQPAPAAQSAAHAPAWQAQLDKLFTLGTDYLHYKLIDAERLEDDRNIPDQTDLYYGFSQPLAGGLTLGSALVLAAVIFGGGFLLFRALK